jgi:predicted transcriptional regulator
LKQIKIEIEFNRTPLYAAFDYIGEEIKTKIEIDGDALKAKGMTQNMAQSQNLGVVPAIEGVHAILKRYERDGMVIIVQQDKKQILVTTKEAAKAQGLKAFPTGK